MTAWDWAEEMAAEFARENLREEGYEAVVVRLNLAAKFRAAAARGARDMRERAAATAKVAWLTAPELDDGSLRNADQDMQLCDQIERAIRALPDLLEGEGR